MVIHQAAAPAAVRAAELVAEEAAAEVAQAGCKLRRG